MKFNPDQQELRPELNIKFNLKFLQKLKRELPCWPMKIKDLKSYSHKNHNQQMMNLLSKLPNSDSESSFYFKKLTDLISYQNN